MLHDLFFLLNDTIKNIERPTTNEPFVIAASSVMLVFHAQFALKSKSVSEWLFECVSLMTTHNIMLMDWG